MISNSIISSRIDWTQISKNDIIKFQKEDGTEGQAIQYFLKGAEAEEQLNMSASISLHPIVEQGQGFLM